MKIPAEVQSSLVLHHDAQARLFVRCTGLPRSLLPPPLLHRTSAPPRTCVAPCYELPAATRCDSRPAPAKLAALLEALQEI